MSTDSRLELVDIVDLNFLQNFQDFFANSMNVALQTFKGVEPITTPSNFIDVCTKYNLSSEIGSKMCKSCLQEWVQEVSKFSKPTIFKCHAGFDNFGFPVFVNGTVIATVLGGKLLTSNPDEESFRKIGREIGVDEDEYFEAVKEVRFLNTEKLDAIATALFHVMNSLVSLAYANYILSDHGIGYKFPCNMGLEQWILLNCEHVNSPLTPREFEILKLVVLGKSNSEIAKELCISPHTAKAHVSSIIEKFSVQDRVQVAVKAVREGIL